jgi:hypothetical protein
MQRICQMLLIKASNVSEGRGIQFGSESKRIFEERRSRRPTLRNSVEVNATVPINYSNSLLSQPTGIGVCRHRFPGDQGVMIQL